MTHAAFDSQAEPKADTGQARSSREYASLFARGGWWVILGAVVPLGLWFAFAALSMAVVAPAFVTVDLNRRPVQHLEGGIVHSVLVRNGQSVKAGDPILVLGDVAVEADRNRWAYRMSAEQAAISRHQAEQNLQQNLIFPADLAQAARADERVMEALEKERALFMARRNSLASEVSLMKEQRRHLDQEIEALHAQIDHAVQSNVSRAKELEAHRRLLADGFISQTRVDQLEGAQSDNSLRLEERRSELSKAHQRLVDIDLKIKSVVNDYSRGASDELKVAAARLAEIEQERRKSDDAAVRQVVRAPAGGEVIGLQFTSPGAVVRAGETIAEIVPGDAKLMIEAQVRPEEINNVQRGQSARIQFTAFKYRNGAMVTGEVSYVSADRLMDKATNLPYYSVTIVADPQSVATAGNDLKLQAGMPAEVYIDGSKQTPLQYVTASITSTVRRAGRQM